MPLTKVAKLVVCFSGNKSSIPARDFLDRVRAKGVRQSNPDCVIRPAVRLDVQPHVWVEFQDKTTQTFDLTTMSGAQLVDKLREISRAGDTKALLQKAGLLSMQLRSTQPVDKPDFGRVQKTQLR